MNYQPQNSGCYYQQQQQQQQSYRAPQHAAYTRSCSTSNLHHYAAQQSQNKLNNYRAYATAHSQQIPAASRSSSNLRQMAYTQSSQCPMAPPQHAQSGIVLQSLSNTQSLSSAARSTSANRIVADNSSMNANLAQFAKYSQNQLQRALSQYPAWLQKEYMRRLQRQYEELYVIEDPKIHHWSAICPRVQDIKPDNAAPAIAIPPEYALSHPNLMGIVSESASEPSSVEYLSESVTLSPSPYAYSPQHQQEQEQTCSPQKDGKFVFDESHDMYKSPSPSPPVNNDHNTQTRAMMTCFQILDYIKDTVHVVANEIILEEEHQAQVQVQVQSQAPPRAPPSPPPQPIQKKIKKIIAVDESKMIKEKCSAKEAVIKPQYVAGNANGNGNGNMNTKQQQMYAAAMQRWYQHKQYQRAETQRQQQYQQLLMQQAMHHQQYLMQQNKYVAQYINQQHTHTNTQCQPQQTQHHMYYAPNAQHQSFSTHHCA